MKSSSRKVLMPFSPQFFAQIENHSALHTRWHKMRPSALISKITGMFSTRQTSVGDSSTVSRLVAKYRAGTLLVLFGVFGAICINPNLSARADIGYINLAKTESRTSYFVAVLAKRADSSSAQHSFIAVGAINGTGDAKVLASWGLYVDSKNNHTLLEPAPDSVRLDLAELTDALSKLRPKIAGNLGSQSTEALLVECDWQTLEKIASALSSAAQNASASHAASPSATVEEITTTYLSGLVGIATVAGVPFDIPAPKPGEWGPTSYVSGLRLLYTQKQDSFFYGGDARGANLWSGIVYDKLPHGQGLLGTSDFTFEGTMKFGGLVHGAADWGKGVTFTGDWVDDRFCHSKLDLGPKGSFTGDFKDGIAANGTMVLSGGDTFEGKFELGKPADGTWNFHDGDSYTGTLTPTDGHMISGTYKWTDGQQFSGKFDQGVPSSNGTWTWKDGSSFTGTVDVGGRSLKGTIIWPDGHKFSGTFAQRAPADGTWMWKDGTTYTGTNDATGKLDGTLKWPDGQEYAGKFVQDAPSDGTWTWANGDNFNGKFVQGVPSDGTWKWKDGSSYVGTTGATGKINGVYQWPNGNRYSGSFVNDQPDNGSLQDGNGVHSVSGGATSSGGISSAWLIPLVVVAAPFLNHDDKNGNGSVRLRVDRTDPPSAGAVGAN
jgi:hypothetical protein